MRLPIPLWVLIVLLAGCNSRGSPPRNNPSQDPPELVIATQQRVLEEVRQPGASVVVVNVWATWCTPCREEFPDIMRLHHEYGSRGLRLVLVSADFEDQAGEARHFLAQQGVDFRSFLKTGNDMEFINGMDPRWTGALPATFVYDGDGTLRHFHEGRTPFAALESLVVATMSPRDTIGKETIR